MPIVPSFILAWRVFPEAKVCTNHLLLVVSYWIGWPRSPAFLSDTRLIIWNLSVGFATVLIKIGSAKSAFVFDEAIRISEADKSESPVLVIAKYTVCGSIFSGKSPLLAIILIDSPFCKACVPIVNTFFFFVAFFRFYFSIFIPRKKHTNTTKTITVLLSQSTK